MPDAPMHPQPCVQKVKARKQVTTGSPVDPAFPARWLYGFLRALPGEPGFLATIIGAMREHFADLISASGYQDHTTSPSACLRIRLLRNKRPPHPAPNVRDDRDTPLLASAGRGGLLKVICPTAQGDFFREGQGHKCRPCPLRPNSDRFCAEAINDAKGHFQTHASQQLRCIRSTVRRE